ncbi:pilus assembly protein [Mesoterricola silvestris]|uniref:PilC beta-propeller domain-containing protein n=1 Tax=Mesoterricola silvestris TaxID=2927979 RepID=A0AA48H7T9_9BACT|nr:hypothetical protein [Mesoterricola silvestris]BDU73368.1 hypothetical protein METEAL_25420 [Mesoterricola silvestris]
MTTRMLATLSRWARLTLVLLALGLLPAMAQLDPKLRVTDTDFLDLFQKSASQNVKPEIVTVLDFSGSMNAVMWHPKYYANSNENNHIPSSYEGGDDANVLPYIKTMSSTTGPTVTFMVFDSGGNQTTTFPLTAGPLVKADGTLVTAADVQAQSGSLNRTTDPSNWVRLATHARITGTYGGVSRTVDIPLPYTIFDSPAGSPSTSASTSYALDPQNGNLVTAFDTLSYLVNMTDATGYFGSAPRNSYGWIGHFWYNHDYFFWLFFGKDEANDAENPTGTTTTSSYIVPDATTSAGKAFMNGVPTLTRYQGVKRAVIMTWLANQTKVYWAFRFLSTGEQNNSKVDPGNGSQSGTGRNLRIFSRATGSNPDPSVKALQDAAPYGGTPLTYAMANTLAQLNCDKNSAFDAPHTNDKYTSPQCQTMFVFLFTDGQANDVYNSRSAIGGSTPYPNTPPATRCNASVGNLKVRSDTVSSLDPGKTNFNIWTLAAVAAHGADPALAPDVLTVPTSYPTDTAKAPDQFAPFFVKKRGNGTAYMTTFTTPRSIQTFTVGVSLAGSYLDSGSGKYSLLVAAAAGDPNQTSWDVTKAEPYSTNNTGTFFFDARDPSAMVNSIGNAITAAVNISNRQTTSAPSIPFAGVALAHQVYLGQFKPPTTGGPVWGGDLMMFPTRTVNLVSSLLDASGQPLIYLDCSTAMWSIARDVFNVAAANNTGGGSAGKGCVSGSSSGTSTSTGCAPSTLATPINWSSRKLLTRLPATAAAPNPDVIAFTSVDPAFSVFKAKLPGSTDAAKQALVDYVRGADPASTTTPKANRIDIMGDIIDSVPNALEYKWAGVTFKNGLPTNVQSALNAHSNAHLRIIFVGTNQGFMHAFAEASWPEARTVNSESISVNMATVGELWAFLPTDFLPYLDYLQTSTNSHRYMTNGSPFVYTLDLPDSSSVAGNGVVDPAERALVIFGLRKGGRSYYAIDVQDPTDPHIKWALNPDEAATIPDDRVLSGTPSTVRTLVGKMGYSTAAMTPGRVMFGGKIRDIFLLGGGLSSTAVEANYSNTALGRSIFGLDLYTGEILTSYDLLSLTGLSSSVVGPIATGVVPFRMFLNSDMHQRAYFSDLKGGIWALGRGVTNTADPLKDFRQDSSEMDKWVDSTGKASVRRLYADSSANGIITTLPAPFLLADFPVTSSSLTNKVHPTAVGIPFVTGNRFNPLDYAYASGTAPTQHRFNVIFDRQDSKITGVDLSPISTAKMTDFSGSNDPAADALNPYNASYYLKTNYGYYVNFPAATVDTTTNPSTYFIPKGISDPTVLAYAAFYSYFNPTASNPCQGGSGSTLSYTICNVVNPVVDSSAVTGTNCASGLSAAWSGVASNFSAIGTVAVIQAGMVIPTTPPPSGESTIMALKTISGNPAERFPKARTWRTVH